MVIWGIDLYVCGSWPMTLKEEHRFRVSDARRLNRISGPKAKDIAGNWRQSHT
jgi:hypothetical protein